MVQSTSKMRKRKVFTLPKPYMNDSNVDQQSGEAVTSDAVRYNIEKTDEKHIH